MLLVEINNLKWIKFQEIQNLKSIDESIIDDSATIYGSAIVSTAA